MKKILILFLILISPALAIVENKKISLSEAIELALKTNPQIKMGKLNVDSSLNEVKIASRLQNPSLHTFQNIGSTANGNPQQIGLDYTIELLKRNKRKKTAFSKYSSSVDNQKYQQHILAFEVKKAYIDFLLKKTNLKLIEEQKNLTKKLLDMMQNESNKGLIPKTDLLQAKIAYNRAIIYTNIAHSSMITSQNYFNSVMNTSNINYDTFEDKLDDNYYKLLTISPKEKTVEFDEIKNIAFNNRYDFQAAKKDVDTAKLNLKLIKSNLIPDIELTGGYAYETKGISDTNSYRQGAYAGVKLINIPIVYRYNPEIQNAKNDIEYAQLKLEDMKIDITRNLVDAWEKFTIARNNLNFYNDELLVNSKELLDASKIALDKKEIDITDFIVSKKLYVELMLGYNETLAEYYLSYAELLKEMNVDELNPNL